MQINVAETTGAGDAFTAGFIYKLIQVIMCFGHIMSRCAG